MITSASKLPLEIQVLEALDELEPSFTSDSNLGRGSVYYHPYGVSEVTVGPRVL
jgi:hypothetical protein